jgi:hypothetical protein
MGTRGLYGFRKNGVDKTTYNHFDSYPDGLGADVINFIKKHSVDELEKFYDRIQMVQELATPTKEEIKTCVDAGLCDLSVSKQSTNDWYCLLRKIQGDLDALYNSPVAYMIDNSDFIKDSLFCEYAYIINLDENVLEYYEGFQVTPDKDNRYGQEKTDGYYPCKLTSTIPLDYIMETETGKIIEIFMNM